MENINRNEVFVITAEEELIGFVDYRHRRDHQTTLYHILVSPEWQGRGIGRKLIEALRTEAIAKGKSYILLKCPENLDANFFYEGLGFKLDTSENGRQRVLNVWRLDIVKYGSN